MNNRNFINHIKSLLKSDDKYLDNEGDLLVDEVRRLANKYDESLLTLLYSDDKARDTFFMKVGNTTVFKQSDFDFFLEEKLIDNSYTAYENRIGLASGNRMLKDVTDVVLNFPYKDCILEGGQSTEEGLDTYFEYNDKTEDYEEKTAKRKEIFFNQVLAKDEIDRLTEPKAFENIKRYTKDGEEEVTEFNRNDEGTITDNLIIKGNNLLALHSLLPEFEGKVKLIYIDPPYNTGNDSFAYNDNFNHSSWLVFMKNRLEQAKKLLADDGVIFVHCDDNEHAHLKVLMDEIQELQYENIFHIKVRHENRILRQDNRYQKVVEQVLCYSKPLYNPNRIPVENNSAQDYRYSIRIHEGERPIINEIAGYEVHIYKRNQYELLTNFESEIKLKEYNIRGSLITQKGSASEYYELNLRERKELDGLGALYKVINMGERGDGLGYRFIRQPFDSTGNNGFYYQGQPLKKQEDKGNPYPNYYDFEKEFNRASNEGNIVFKNGKKPELFLKKIFEISNIQTGELVLDYHLGSGSTCAVAQKLGLRYIGIEQVDDQIEIANTRLNNVIHGDQTGISKAGDWKGGGSFVYMELAKNNQKAIEYIENCKSYDELVAFFDEMCATYFLDYNLKIKEFKETVSKEDNFKALSLDQQKNMFAKMLDLNQLYVNVSDMEDAKFKLSDKDIQATKDFYKK